MWLGKRLFDLFFAVLGLIALSPVFAVIAIWIKKDSEGPVFFRQERVGLGGHPFRIHKFRTMRMDNHGLLVTVGGDPRITRSGNFLRKYKLDELAQIIDVLKGDMSFVGPRPEVPRYVAAYPEEIKQKALSVRPGITDWASLEFKDENDILRDSKDPEKDYIEKILPAKLKYHLKYVESASFLGDIKVILLTLKAIFFRG
jgi:lipopolysaccharide/colanic/teichoic acid biosynthesis glycosyltransferase